MRLTYQFRGVTAANSLFNAYVRAKLEYGGFIWDPYEKNYTVMLERIQRKFARYVFKRMYGYYPYLYPSLFVTGMIGRDTLELRRKLLLLKHYYLLLNNKVNNPSALERIGFLVPRRHMGGSRGSIGPRRRMRLFTSTSAVRTRRAANAPTPRALSLLNDLLTHFPDIDVHSDSLGLFLKCVVAFLSKK